MTSCFIANISQMSIMELGIDRIVGPESYRTFCGLNTQSPHQVIWVAKRHLTRELRIFLGLV